MNSNETRLDENKADIRIISKSFSPRKLLKLYDADEYEEIITEWMESYLKVKYSRIENVGGPGDKGRDIICTYEDGKWDNYQCKHYEKPLTLSQALSEIAKIIFNVYRKALTSFPQKYYFVSPQGVNIKLRDTLNDAQALKESLVIKWDQTCSSKIITGGRILLDDNLRKYIDNVDFSIFDYIDPDEFIRGFKQTPYYTKRFGQLNKPRPLNFEVNSKIEKRELVYIEKILAAYADYLNKDLNLEKMESDYSDLKKHFDRQRQNYFSAEYLNAYSRETYDPECKYFDNLKSEIYDGIIDQIEDDANNGFDRLKKVLKRAEQIQTTRDNPLSQHLNVKDRKGICHHLANERDDVKWKK
jgi:hypothetical protein